MPQGPIEITDVRAKKATLHWEKPEDDGGSPITQYIIERQDVDTGRWVPCCEAGPDDRETTVDGLTEGKKYKSLQQSFYPFNDLAIVRFPFT